MRFHTVTLLYWASSAAAGLIWQRTAAASFLSSKRVDASQYLVETAPGKSQWVTEEKKWELRRQGINFIDITDEPKFGTSARGNLRATEVVFPTSIQQSSRIKPLIAKLQTEPMQANLVKFSSFHNRYFKSAYGAQSSQLLLGKVTETMKASGAMEFGATVKPFIHAWGQNSIIATIPGKSKKTIVLGAHQDSINLRNPKDGRAPGADDDGSGSVTILEAMRVMLQNDEGKRGKAPNTIEFHWYSGEEGGLLGSGAIFKQYQEQKRDVRAMLNQDMTGFIGKTKQAGKEEAVGVITDFVDPDLTQFIQKVIKEYCKIPYVLTKCGYACSDHASARKAGYPSSFVIEAEFKYTLDKIHTADDTLQYISYPHILEHAKMSLGLAMELAFANV